MRLFVAPCDLTGKGAALGPGCLLMHREGEDVRLLMHQVHCQRDASTEAIRFIGEFVQGESFLSLQDGDRLFYAAAISYNDNFDPFYIDLFATKDLLLPFADIETALGIAANIKDYPSVAFVTPETEQLINRAESLRERAESLYRNQPAYRQIMLKQKDGGVEVLDLLGLAARQAPEKREKLETMFLAMSDLSFVSQVRIIAEQILKQCEFSEPMSLLTQEEQVEAFITFSKAVAAKKEEHVPDTVIEAIKQSPEYGRAMDVLAGHGLGVSKTQQFNVLQSVGLFSLNQSEKILYNLSDMGAGKTLMTVEAIYLLDLKRMSEGKQMIEKNLVETERSRIVQVSLPDKHILAPTLSIKSSWIDTFKLFYETEEQEDGSYVLTLQWEGLTAKSRIDIVPFTVKDEKIFVKQKFPEAEGRSYLIIDEIHQLVKKKVSRSKFFPAGLVPIDRYDIFVLSGTMSNMTTAQWYYMIRFLGLSGLLEETPQKATDAVDEYETDYRTAVKASAEHIREEQHRYFNGDPITAENEYYHIPARKQTSIERAFFAKYGSAILVPYLRGNTMTVEECLENDRYGLTEDPTEHDCINFELFYRIVGDRAITAQSIEVAEELFGEQKKQHVSDIIKTVSPLSPSDIQLLKVLHHIAADYNQYKSPTIAKAINCAILNLNDGLQTKNLYDIVSQAAERNIRFLKYLSGLDVNVLEQLPKSGLIAMPKLADTNKFKVLKDILEREKEETHLIVVNDFQALKALSDALGIEHLSKEDLKREMSYQELLDELFEKQSIVIVTQDMIKSSLDLIQANRLIQYQLNTEISDIIQTQNRINRIGQTRETKCYYIASDQLQETLIELFLESYRNIRVAHRGIVELFVDITTQINVINDYLDLAFGTLEAAESDDPAELPETEVSDLVGAASLPEAGQVIEADGICQAILYPKGETILVLVPLISGNAFPLGMLKPELGPVTQPVKIKWNLNTNQIVRKTA